MTQQDTTEYAKYCNFCKQLDKPAKSFHDWYYCTYSAVEESWRLQGKLN